MKDTSVYLEHLKNQKKAQDDYEPFCSVCERVRLWHPAVEAYICLKCDNRYGDKENDQGLLDL